MKTEDMPRSLLVLLLASCFAPVLGHAYVDVELEGGRHVIGEYYTTDAAKLTVYRPSGAIEVDRATVRAIREPSGDMPAEVQSASSAPARTDSSAAAISSPHASAAPVKDPAQRENELAHQLVDTRLDRLAAMQRGDDEAMKKLDKQIKNLQGERQENWKKLHPPSDASDE